MTLSERDSMVNGIQASCAFPEKTSSLTDPGHVGHHTWQLEAAVTSHECGRKQCVLFEQDALAGQSVEAQAT